MHSSTLLTFDRGTAVSVDLVDDRPPSCSAFRVIKWPMGWVTGRYSLHRGRQTQREAKAEIERYLETGDRERGEEI